jgi:predicted pyridoxine 5'-phosphate oxidase superfamily flavin-nucleotide-binding protein
MVVIPEAAKRFIEERFDKEYNGTVGVLGSMGIDGTPNASPKHFRIRDDEHLEFTDVFSKTLGEILKKVPDVAIVFFDPQAVIGYRFKGKAELETFGPLLQQAADQLESMGFKPKAVVLVKIEEVQWLHYGPDAGKKLA